MDNRRQIDRFKETARALGCDEDKEKFEAQLGKIAKPQQRAEKREAHNVKKKNIINKK